MGRWFWSRPEVRHCAVRPPDTVLVSGRCEPCSLPATPPYGNVIMRPRDKSWQGNQVNSTIRKRLIFLIGIAVLAAPVVGQAQTKAAEAKATTPSANTAGDELKQIENDWVAASKAKDAAKLGEILAD